jgi:hypothetical protein
MYCRCSLHRHNLKIYSIIVSRCVGESNLSLTFYLSGLIWINFIQHFGDVKGAILLNYTAWYQSGTPLTVSDEHTSLTRCLC